MPKRKNPQTSMDAYNQVHPDMITAHHAKIIGALRLVAKGMMYEQIAAHTRMDKHQVGRRLSELERRKDVNGNPAPLVYKTGETRKTVANRDANVYQLTAAGEAYIIPDKYLPGKTISEYAKAIQSIQPTLF